MELHHRLTGTGWAEAEVIGGSGTATVRTSYAANALEQLLDAAERLLGGARQARCTWSEEPGGTAWVFRRCDAVVHLRLLNYGDIEGRHPDDDGELVLETYVDVEELAAVVAEAAEAVRDTHGEVEYLRLWCSPFPTAELASLRELIDAGH